ncbi:hypothetical protein [Paenibacillus tianjinensis]|uniref:Uncharacterized protein n=1 Tax=Paenibacillus tianjinensis TaxID=2810347 RepID=A0ABX7LFQ5_9BACL|nr:hypothetical protein [Paenibacillus tianjinensis]QSF45703.1 hypothetical protein JRJ22_03415 [Paenibacillus tianjinensis]
MKGISAFDFSAFEQYGGMKGISAFEFAMIGHYGEMKGKSAFESGECSQMATER